LVDAAVLGPLILTWRGARPAVAATPRRTWLLCGSALLIAIAFLYLPPLIHELRSGQGNFVGYFLKSDIPAQPYNGGFPRRALRALDGLVRWSAHENFSTTAQFVSRDAMILRLSLAGGCGAVFALLYWAALRRGAGDPAAGFLALVVVVCWSILALKGHAIRDHHLIPAYAAIPLLIGWTAGRLIRRERMAADSTPGTRGHGSIALRALGLMVLLSAAGLSLAQFPRAWAIHEGAARNGHRLKSAQEVAAFIAGDGHGGPFSVDLAEADNFPAHFHYLLRRLGRPPGNEDDYSHRILRRDMGERIYVIVANTMTRVPRLEGLPGAPPKPVLELDDYSVHRLEVASLPPQTRAIELVIDAPAWTIRAER
jgi:hypothetical protein